MGIKSNNLAAAFHDFFSRSGKLLPTPPPPSYQATGGIQIIDGSSTYNIFLSPDTYEVEVTGPVGSVELLVVAAGGGGGGANDRVGGGGGAGQVNYYPAFSIEARTYNISIGTGGSGGQDGANGSKGGDTHFDPGGSTPVPANGGGYGGGGTRGGASNSGGPGGSGGGGVGWDNPQPGGSSVLNSLPVAGGTAYGNAGVAQPVGGGGGAGTAGGSNPRSGNPPYYAGEGQPFPSFPAPIIAPAIPAPVRPAWTQAVGSSGYFGGGGASAGYNGFNVTGGYQGPTYGGGWGGGGSGGPPGGPNQGPGIPGVDYTGGGAAGSWIGSPGGDGGDGGDGIIIVKYTEA